MKTLIIAEKPSVAGDLARVLGKLPRKGDHYENDEYIIGAAVGHIVELFMPEDIDKQFKRWTVKDLPIIPEKFQLKPIAKNKKKFQELKALMARKDVGCLINACDAGREGELIFTYLVEQAKCKKPVKRLWMSSMTPAAIRNAFAQLREDEEMQPLRDAARCRSEADWLIGINGTRGATVIFGRRGGAATVGRVQTPTLSMVYQRELEIREFIPRDYWRLSAKFNIHAGGYEGVYQKPDFRKEDDKHDRADRLWDKSTADSILADIQASPQAEVSEEKKRTRQSSPRLYDLTTLQREANQRFGFPAGATLKIAQDLYEKHKALTYPRTDSRALPSDYPATVRETLAVLPHIYRGHADKVLEQKWVRDNDKRVFNNAQVSDHFAIIPTNSPPKKLSEREQKIYDMVVRRFIAVFYPAAEFDVTTRLSVTAGHTFKTEGKVLAEPGWLAVYGKDAIGTDTLPPLSPADGDPVQARIESVDLIAEATKPPPRYTEATLLAAMEGAGKLVEDEDLAEAMKEKGLGTPATRAATIDHLLRENYLQREGRDLLPTEKAEGLMQFLKRFDIEALTSPNLTGEWEYRLRRIEEGKLTRTDFMQGITDLTRDIVRKMASPPPPDKCDLLSPTDGKHLLEDHRAWFSQDSIEVRGREIPRVSVNKIIGNRSLSSDELQKLLTEREIGPLEGFRSRAGKAFAAVVKLVEKDNGTLRAELDFGNGNGSGANGVESLEDLANYPDIGKSPVDGTPVRATPAAYVSEGTDKDGKPAFRLSRNMLGKVLEAAQISKLLVERKTDIIKGFRSNRTGRMFDAHLTLDDKGKIGFEFPPRAPRKKAARKKVSMSSESKSEDASKDA